jgi:myo-inositol 2-dehydrogenase/D-chiro-inositol 1-dehydrogenase
MPGNISLRETFRLEFASATRLRDKSVHSGLIYQVGHNRRFAPVYKVLKAAIEKNELRPLSVHAKMNRGEL